MNIGTTYKHGKTLNICRPFWNAHLNLSECECQGNDWSSEWISELMSDREIGRDLAIEWVNESVKEFAEVSELHMSKWAAHEWVSCTCMSELENNQNGSK